MKTKIIFMLTPNCDKIPDAYEYSKYLLMVKHIDADFDAIPPIGSTVCFAVEDVFIRAKVDNIEMEIYDRNSEMVEDVFLGTSRIYIYVNDAEVLYKRKKIQIDKN